MSYLFSSESVSEGHPDKVAAVVDFWRRKDPKPTGHLVDVLGDPGENDTEMHAILAEYNLPYRFEPEVARAADSISDVISPEDLKGRRDFRDVLTITIDPTDAKDFDDAQPRFFGTRCHHCTQCGRCFAKGGIARRCNDYWRGANLPRRTADGAHHSPHPSGSLLPGSRHFFPGNQPGAVGSLA